MRVEVLVGSLQIEWPIGKTPVKNEKQFQQGDVLKMPRERAASLGSSVKVIEEGDS